MKIVSLVGCLLLALPIAAEQIRVEYSSFYSHTRKLQDEDLQALQFSFGFKHITENRLCQINSAYIHTQKKTLPLSVNNENRFSLPTEKALKMAKAEVVVALQEAANKCDMSVQLETKPTFLKSRYSAEELKVIFNQYQNFFDEMGGFLSFLMPSATGLNFVFKQPVVDIPQGGTANGSIVTLDQAFIDKGQGVDWQDVPIRITASTSD